jgi:transcriptional regulator with XRE-family HTH domain
MWAAAKPQRRLKVGVLYVTIDTMETDNPLSDALRQAIRNSGLPLLQIAEQTGVERASLSRFVAGKRSLRLDMADKLAAYFGLTLTKTEQVTKKKPKE